MKKAVLFLCLLMAAPFVLAQDTSDAVRLLVQAFLNAQMAREAGLVEYAYEGATWPDGALGCPVEGNSSYTQGEVPGYRWSYLMDDGMRYAIHTDATGEQIILCAQESEAAFTYSVYTNPLYTIKHPNLWTARPASQEETRFYFRGQASCTLPGMRVLAVADTGDMAGLLDTYFTGVSEAPAPDSYRPVGADGLGRTARYTLDCQGVQVTQQVTVLPGTTNTAFLILQAAPSGIFEAWAAPFLSIVTEFQPGTGSVTGLGADIASAGTPLPPSPVPSTPTIFPTVAPVQGVGVPTAAVTLGPTVPVPAAPTVAPFDIAMVPLANTFVGDVYIGRTNDLPGYGVTGDGSIVREGLRVSSDGLQLAYIEAGSQIYTVSTSDPGAPNLLSDTVAAGYPPAWAPDQAALAFLTPAEDDEDTLDIQLLFPDGSQESAGTVPYEGGCESESAYAVDHLYWQETGLEGNGLTFEWLPGNRFLLSDDCDGLGLSIFSMEDDNLSSLGENLRRAQLSPDKSRIVAIEDEVVVLVDLSTGESRPLTTSLAPDQVGWDVTGTQIYYSNVFEGETLLWEDESTEDAALEYLGIFPFESRLNTITLFQVDTVSGIEAQLWQGTGFAIGQMRGMPDGSGLLFTLVPSDRGLVTSFVNGAEARVLRNSTPETQLYYLRVDFAAPGAPAQLLAIAGQPRFAPASAAPPATVPLEATPTSTP
jgi:hypothetical protein